MYLYQKTVCIFRLRYAYRFTFALDAFLDLAGSLYGIFLFLPAKLVLRCCGSALNRIFSDLDSSASQTG